MVSRPPCPFGQYWLLEMLSQGGSGAVYLATIPGTRSLFVIKRLRDELAGDPMLSLRLQHEAAVVVSVDSPHVVQVFDVGAVAGEPYIAMAYIAGWPLARLLQRLSEEGLLLPPPAVAAILADGLRGLIAVHTASHPTSGAPLGVVHRDIAPRNLILDRSHRLKIIDLGIGRSNIQEWATRTGTLLGTPGYMAPEQVLGRRVDHRADLYSLFVVTFELLTCVHYLERGDRQRMFEQCVAGAFRPPSELRPELKPAFDRLLERGLAVHPEDRFSSAEEALASVEQALGPIAPLDPASLPLSFDAEVKAEVERVEALAAEAKSFDEDRSRTVVYAQRPSSVARTLTLPETRSKRRLAAIAPVAGMLALLGGMLLGFDLAEQDPPPPPEPISVPASEPKVEVRAREIEAAPDPEPARKKTRVQRPPPAVSPTPAHDPPSVHPAPESFEVLIREASELRTKRPDLRTGADEIIADGLMWRRAEPSAERSAAWADLRARLDRLK